MEIVEKIENGPVLICPKVFKDERGYFYESFNDSQFKELVCNTTFVQDNQSLSSYGVLRGMHFQKGDFAQAKLIRVIKGAVLDVVLDIRDESPNYGKFYSYLITEENHYQLFVPRGFAHGFLSLKDDTIFQYKCDNFYNKGSEGSFNFDSFGFDWSKYVSKEDLIISDKDRAALLFTEKNIIEVSKEAILDFIHKVISDDMSIATQGLSLRAKVPFTEKIYAEVTTDYNETIVVQLKYLTEPLFDFTSITHRRGIVGVNTGDGKLVPVEINNVKRFFRYE